MKESSPDTPVDEGDEGFLSRWSRRKQQAREEAVEVEESVAQVTEPEQEPLSQEPEYHPTDEDMPPLESLGEDSDYSGFMSPKVSDELRRLALRKLFHSSSFHVLDGLNDYDDDYTKFEKLGDIVTSDMKFMARQEALKAEREAAAQQEGNPETVTVETEGQSLEPVVENELDDLAEDEHDALALDETESIDDVIDDIDEEDIPG